MVVLPLLLCAALAASSQQQSAFVSGDDTLGKERQEFHRAISTRISPSIKSRTNLRAMDSALDSPWRGNDDGYVGETYIFPAGHSDRVYLTGVNPGWNAQQDVNYNSITCFAKVNGEYLAIWTLDWRDPQVAIRPKNGPGLTKLIALDANRVDHKYVKDEIIRERPYAVYKRGDGDSPWISEYYDEKGNRIASRSEDASKSLYVFNTFVEEQAFMSKNP